MQHLPGKGRDSVKLTAFSTVIPETPRPSPFEDIIDLPKLLNIYSRSILSTVNKASIKYFLKSMFIDEADEV